VDQEPLARDVEKKNDGLRDDTRITNSGRSNKKTPTSLQQPGRRRTEGVKVNAEKGGPEA